MAVEEILDNALDAEGGELFYVWWEGYKKSKSTWEPAQAIDQDCLAAYKRSWKYKSVKKNRVPGRQDVHGGGRTRRRRLSETYAPGAVNDDEDHDNEGDHEDEEDGTDCRDNGGGDDEDDVTGEDGEDGEEGAGGDGSEGDGDHVSDGDSPDDHASDSTDDGDRDDPRGDGGSD